MSLNYFFAIVILTILATRFLLGIRPVHSPNFGKFHLHHYMYGLVLIGLYFLIAKPWVLAVGAGLLIDELPLFLLFKHWNWPRDHWKEYFSWQCYTGIAVLLILAYLGLYLFQIKVI